MAAISSTDPNSTFNVPAGANVQVVALTRCCIQRLPHDHEVRVGADTITLTARRMTNPEPGSVLAAVIARQ